jgi:hypothetical protein
MVAAAAVILALVVHPMAAIVVAPWAAVAAAQETAVISKAIVTRNPRLAFSSTPVALYDFAQQKEISSRHFGSIGAHAHEMARALMQSRGAVIPRLVAPVVLAVALLDRVIAALVSALDWLMDRIVGKAPALDEQMLQKVEQNGKALKSLFSEPVVAKLPVASGAWQRISTGLKAVYKNSEARQAAADLAARRAIGASA